jgi:hypothetical protein
VKREAYKIRLIYVVDNRCASEERDDNDDARQRHGRSPRGLSPSSEFLIHILNTTLRFLLTDSLWTDPKPFVSSLAGNIQHLRFLNSFPPRFIDELVV